MRLIKTSMFNCGSVLFVRLFCFELLRIIDIALYHRYKVRAQYREYISYLECNTIAFFSILLISAIQSYSKLQIQSLNVLCCFVFLIMT